MSLIDRSKLVSWLNRAQRRVNDLSHQVQCASDAVKGAKNVFHEAALKARQKTVETDLRKAKANLHSRRAELEAFDAKTMGADL